jgi:quercetin dioxygenase-like cupin family protein
MRVASTSAERTIQTAAGVMTALAAPSQGSREVCSWRTTMAADAEGPVHVIDREQVWMPVSGSLSAEVDGITETAAAGQALILPAGATRQIRAGTEGVDVVVCMPVGGKAYVPGEPEPRDIPWAE